MNERFNEPGMMIGYYITSAMILIILFIILSLIFQTLDFSIKTVILLAASTIIGCFFNVPVIRLKQKDIYMNIGGGIVPVGFSIYFIWLRPDLIIQIILATLVLIFFTYCFSTIDDDGIRVYILVPLIGSIIVASLLPGSLLVIGYVSGTLGTLIGADIMNLDNIQDFGFRELSIGGAGTLDAIFVTGLIILIVGSVI